MSKRGKRATQEQAKIEQAKAAAQLDAPKESTNKVEEPKAVAMANTVKESNNLESVTQQAGDSLESSKEQAQPIIETITGEQPQQPELDQASAGVDEAISSIQTTDTAEV